MVAQKSLIRELLLYEFELGHNAAEAIKNICTAKGENAVKKRTAFNWFKKFKNGNKDLEEKARSGRPLSINPDVLREAFEVEPATSTRRLSAALGTPRETVRRHLHRLDMVRRSCHKVPHDLTAEQAQRRKTICQELLTNPMDERFLKRIITCDEKWVYYKNPDLRKQWIKKGEAPLQVPK